MQPTMHGRTGAILSRALHLFYRPGQNIRPKRISDRAMPGRTEGCGFKSGFTENYVMDKTNCFCINEPESISFKNDRNSS